jgi:hypothetical protein
MRQRQALDTMAYLDSLREDSTLIAADREELSSRVLQLESRGRVVTEAQRRLGMREAESSEIVFLQGESR